MLLEARALNKRFDGLQAVDNVDIAVERGEILGLIGPNGSGKSTVMNLIMGVYRPDSGQIRLDGVDISKWPLHRVAEAGVSMVFQHSRPLPQQTVLQNVQLALLPDSILNLRMSESVNREGREILARVGLANTADRSPNELPFAGLRRLELAKSLARKPALLLLDEPFAGLSALEVREFAALIQSLREEGRAIVLVDHNVKSVRAMVDRIVAMSSGAKIADDLPDRVLADQRVREVYLGDQNKRTSPIGEMSSAVGKALEVKNASVRYGKAIALNSVSFAVSNGGIAAIVGLNGAGKTSLFNAICGLTPCTGQVLYQGVSLTDYAPDEIARSGLVLCPETRELFGDMTVAENLGIGGSWLSSADRARQRDLVESLFPRLAERRAQKARTLSGGEQQQLAIGRALMMKPRLLLIDEPTLGLAPVILDVISDAIEAMRATGDISILIAEQNVTFALRHANEINLLEHGEIVWSGATGRFLEEAGQKIL
ncbi:ATP-binding cassette domain-containing protein [Terrarubrum flagellatum]|uniref:ATP-binding cassette domain-containing protein n=1 Tax=Terrirubrum flagellatum TaxID=2895980 RepID=UPI0031454C52